MLGRQVFSTRRASRKKAGGATEVDHVSHGIDFVAVNCRLVRLVWEEWLSTISGWGVSRRPPSWQKHWMSIAEHFPTSLYRPMTMPSRPASHAASYRRHCQTRTTASYVARDGGLARMVTRGRGFWNAEAMDSTALGLQMYTDRPVD